MGYFNHLLINIHYNKSECIISRFLTWNTFVLPFINIIFKLVIGGMINTEWETHADCFYTLLSKAGGIHMKWHIQNKDISKIKNSSYITV